MTGWRARTGTTAKRQREGDGRGRLLRYVALAVCLVVMTGAALVLVGWLTEIAKLESFLPAGTTMKPNTALAFLLSDASLTLQLVWPSSKRLVLLAGIGAALVLVIGFVTLLEHVSEVSPALDRVLPADRGPSDGQAAISGRVEPATAMGILLISAALLLRGWKAPIWQPAEVLAGVAAVLGCLGFLGFCTALRRWTSWAATPWWRLTPRACCWSRRSPSSSPSPEDGWSRCSQPTGLGT
ncbi:hypothetical protein [Candidatus Nephthysia bennettiae]|uniref:Uncharacterized protein n=1 Tax=Candidatus Nephthysia bennettiae TaxID=3127016 RepID=A0A934NBD9_9BACT|nr:hypothetical protein [Candidatus Dormibacteraeota bacterium]